MKLNESPFAASYAPRPEKPIVALKPKAWSVFLSWKNLRGIIFIIPLFFYSLAVPNSTTNRIYVYNSTV